MVTDWKGNHSLAKNDAATRKRVGSYNPDTETGDVLDDIANVEVEIRSVTFDTRRGRNGEYTLSIITLTDGRVFHTGGPVVAERLTAIPVNEFPVLGTFSKVKSQNDPSRSYWTVE